MAKKNRPIYVGVDVGGTKILAALVEPSGEVLARGRRPTPRDDEAGEAPAAILDTIADLLDGADGRRDPCGASARLAAIALAVPGVVDPRRGRVVVTPNMALAGTGIASRVGRRFGVPVVLGNDVNCGTLGEAWLGAARGARDVVGIFPGTGIGGGILLDGKLVRGARESAGEIGHMVMQIGGPLCGCGNRGCLEALASRTAIERDIRQAVADGRKTVLLKAGGEKPKVLKSRKLRAALDAKDKLAVEVVTRAAEVLGLACVNIRHVLDPEVIVLGGGLIEACGEFILPIVRRVVAGDKLPGAGGRTRIVPSALGDDAVVLGAVAMAKALRG